MHVTGLNRTSEKVVRHHVEPCLQAQTKEELQKRLSEAERKLRLLDIFQSIEFHVGNDLHVHVKEKGILSARAGTSLGNSEGNLNSSVNFRNLFGRGESISMNASLGTVQKSLYDIVFSKPLWYDAERRLDVYVNKQEVDKKYALHTEESIGFGSKIAMVFKNINYDVGYEAKWRTLNFVEHSTNNVKSAVYHEIKIDTRDNNAIPKRGIMAKIYSELGMGSHIFLKTKITAQKIFEFKYCFVSFHGVLGSIYGQSSLSDKFFCGGPTCVRGLMFNSMGPGSHLGKFGCSLFVPISWLNIHCFFNAAQLDSDVKRTMGLGLAARYSNIRIETNLLSNGKITFGIGISFL